MSKLAAVITFMLFLALPGTITPRSSNSIPQDNISLLTPALMAQEPPAAEEHAAGEHATAEGEHAASGEHAAGEHAAGEEHSLWHEVAHYLNFAVLLGLVIWGVKKMLIPFLNERGQLIRQDMQRSAEAIEQANQRLKAMEDRMANLDRELSSLRESGLNEARAERLRIEKEAETEAAKILAGASAEMDSAVKAARQELQSYASLLALNVAEKKIKGSLTPQSDKQILNSFIEKLSSGSDGASGRKS